MWGKHGHVIISAVWSDFYMARIKLLAESRANYFYKNDISKYSIEQERFNGRLYQARFQLYLTIVWVH